MKRYFVAAILIGGCWTASIARAIDFGWEPLPDGGIEYRVQVEPELVGAFHENGFSSEIPPGLRDIRRIRIEVGRTALPNQGDITGPAPARPQPAVASESPTYNEPPQDTGVPALLDQSRGGASLPFFHPGTAKPIRTDPVTPAAAVEPTSVDAAKFPAPALQGAAGTELAVTDQPWPVLMIVLLGLFASLGANLFLGWIHLGTRSKYRALLQYAPRAGR